MAKKTSTGTATETAPAEPKVETYRETLKVTLTAAEVADKAQQSAHLVAALREKDAEQKAAAKHHKSVIEGMEADLDKLSGEVRSASTYSAVECQRVYDYGGGKVIETRLDTGEVLNDRRMTDSERQLSLPFESLPFKSNGQEDGGHED